MSRESLSLAKVLSPPNELSSSKGDTRYSIVVATSLALSGTGNESADIELIAVGSQAVTIRANPPGNVHLQPVKSEAMGLGVSIKLLSDV